MIYKKKPVMIEAHQLTKNNIEMVLAWCGGKRWSEPPLKAVTGIMIYTLEGAMTARFGDYVIKGIKGEFYPCKPDIFEATYEYVDRDGTLTAEEFDKRHKNSSEHY